LAGKRIINVSLTESAERWIETSLNMCLHCSSGERVYEAVCPDDAASNWQSLPCLYFFSRPPCGFLTQWDKPLTFHRDQVKPWDGPWWQEEFTAHVSDAEEQADDD